LKSSSGSRVIPSRSITRLDRAFWGTVKDTISSSRLSSKPNASPLRAASVA
jgi:hypothetical protein